MTESHKRPSYAERFGYTTKTETPSSPAPELVKPAPGEQEAAVTASPDHLPAYTKVRAGEVMGFECIQSRKQRRIVYYSSILGGEAHGDTFMTLITSFALITFEGQGLEKLRKRLNRREVEYIYEGGQGGSHDDEADIKITCISFDESPTL